MKHEKQIKILDKYGIFLGFDATFVFAFIFVFTPYWWLALVAGVIGGIFVLNTKSASRVGFLGVLSAWIIFLLIKIAINEILSLIDLIGNIIIGGSGNGWIILLIIMIVGGCMGALGAYFGSALRGLLFSANQPEEKKENKN
jgi:hypothetical protein